MSSASQALDGAARRGSTIRLSARWISLPVVLWLCAWAAINTNPENISDFGLDRNATINAIRAVCPLGVFLLGIMALPGAPPRKRSWVELGFWGYGLVALLACTGSASWFEQAYWGFAFLGALATAELVLRYGSGRLRSIERLNYLSWAVTVLALVAMLFIARDVLIAPGSENSSYGLINRFQSAHGYGISRETGLSRMAVVPALISLVIVLTGKNWQKALAFVVLAASTYIIWIMQSRGALFSFLGAFLFVLLFASRRRLTSGRIVSAIVGGAAIYFLTPNDDVSGIWMHATRGTGAEGFITQSGRTDIWMHLLDQAAKSPVFGYGFQADRLFEYNAQNAFIYALLCGGIIGVVLFVLAMIAAWRRVLKLLPLAGRLPERERRTFLITSALLVFYTLRSIPENSAALFSVDLLLQYPAMLYLVQLAAMVREPGVRPAAGSESRLEQP